MGYVGEGETLPEPERPIYWECPVHKKIWVSKIPHLPENTCPLCYYESKKPVLSNEEERILMELDWEVEDLGGM